MGEQVRRINAGQSPKGIQGQQIHVDLSRATQKQCACGCKFFIPVIAVYTVSALLSPTGQELAVQQPVLTCMECKEILK